MNNIKICNRDEWIAENYCLTPKECNVSKYINMGIDFFRTIPTIFAVRVILRRDYELFRDKI